MRTFSGGGLSGIPLQFALLAMLGTPAAFATIYGADDRMPVALAPAAVQELAPALGIFISNQNIVDRGETFDLKTSLLEETASLCPEVPGKNLPSFFVGCTGFLVAEDILVTAGHCMVNFGEVRDTVTPQCETFSWVADFQESPATASAGRLPPQIEKIPKSKLWECEKVIYAAHTSETGETGNNTAYNRDFAVVKLKRKTGRAPLPLASQLPGRGDAISILGHPLSVPLAYTSNAKILSLEAGYYRANLDAFPGNSGSPVFNASREVIGILVRGYPESLNWDFPRQCNLLNRCDLGATRCLQNPESERIGEHIEPIVHVRKFLTP